MQAFPARTCSERSSMSRLIAIALLGLACAGARADQAEAVNAALADTATTAVSLAAGMVELNPLGAAGAVAVKVATMAYIKELPQTQQAHQYSVVSSLWGGASASNLCWLTGAGPACFLLGVIRGQYIWNKGEDERAFWEICESERRTDASLQCEWKKVPG
ncbi:MAG: hypothetical protein JWP77_1879 [Polaromonas sp.]|jgi:hypothetical protein|nr:hypothetical protein [Polaromonas sp.]